jgi:predicted dehydrogenase
VTSSDPSQKLRVVLVALGGYAHVYIEGLLSERAPQEGIVFAAGVDPFADASPDLGRLQERKIPIYDDLNECLSEVDADLVVVSSPIHLHREHTCTALERGCHVLCEKPVSGAIQDAIAMRQARDAAGKHVTVAYNVSLSPMIQKLKQDIVGGKFGAPKRFKCIALEPRAWGYYGRNDWAGRLAMGPEQWVADGPMHNASSHSVHNMLYLLGRDHHSSAQPVAIQGELYRANDIENYDTATCRVEVENGVTINILMSHAVIVRQPPACRYEFEDAVIEQRLDEDIVARFSDGHEEVYKDVDEEQYVKLWKVAAWIRAGEPSRCSLEAAIPELLVANGAQESMPEVTPFPQDRLKTEEFEGDEFTIVDGLREELLACHENWTLPSEAGLAWAQPGRKIDMRGYDRFPQSALLQEKAAAGFRGRSK